MASRAVDVLGRCDGWLLGAPLPLLDELPGTRVDCEREGREGLSGARFGERCEELRATGAEGAALDMVTSAAADMHCRSLYYVDRSMCGYVYQCQLRGGSGVVVALRCGGEGLLR